MKDLYVSSRVITTAATRQFSTCSHNSRLAVKHF